MSADWPPPQLQPPQLPPPPGPDDAPPGYGYNWGFAYPVGYQPVAWVPRPPRPGVVNLAVVLTLVGVLISGIQMVIDLRYTYLDRGEVVSQLNDGTAGGNSSNVVNTAFTIGLVFAVVVWLLPAAGAVVTALLARGGSNAARIVLASLTGLFALNDLCSGVFGLVKPELSGLGTTRESGISPIFDLVLTALAVAIGVLVLLPSANRFFTPGLGRRFMAST